MVAVAQQQQLPSLLPPCLWWGRKQRAGFLAGSVSPLPMAGHDSNQPLLPGEAEFNGLHCGKPLIQFWEIPAAPVRWAEATDSYHPRSSGLPGISFPYKSHLAFQHGARLSETAVLSMLQ